VQVSASSGDFAKSTKEYLHRFYANFEHEIGSGGDGGDSGDSGGIFAILAEEDIYKSSLIKYFVYIYIYIYIYFIAGHISYFENLQTFSCVIF
jgi:hypothetical protein